MTEPAPELFQYWGHSFEEYEAGMAVYRPATHPFPPARGRDGLELRADGSAVRWRIGRGDAPEPAEGQWRMDSAGGVVLSFPLGDQTSADAAAGLGGESIEVVEVTPDSLRVRVDQ